MNHEPETITPEEIEMLEKLSAAKIESDEDYQQLGEIFDENE